MLMVKGIARYVHAVNPSAPKGTDKMRYGISVLIAKNDPQVPVIQAAFDQTKLNGFPGGVPGSAEFCWNDCAVSEAATPALAGYMDLRCSTGVEHGQPQIMDMAQQPIPDPALDGKLSGQIVWVAGDFASYTLGKQGIKCYFNGLMVTGEVGPIDGSLLSSKPDVAGAFAAAAAGMAQAAAPAAAPAAVPTAGAPAPIPGAPTPAAPPAAPAPQPQFVMTAAANGLTREQYHASGWTDEQLVQNGLMQPPGGVAPAFMS